VTGRKTASSFVSSTLAELAGATVRCDAGAARAARAGENYARGVPCSASEVAELKVVRPVPLDSVDESSMQGAAAFVLPSDGLLFEEEAMRRNFDAFGATVLALAAADLGLIATARFDFAAAKPCLCDLPYLLLPDTRAGAGAGAPAAGEEASDPSVEVESEVGGRSGSSAMLLRRINLPEEELPFPAEALPAEPLAPPSAAVALAKTALEAWAQEAAEEQAAANKALGETGATVAVNHLLDTADLHVMDLAATSRPPTRARKPAAATGGAKKRRTALQLRGNA